MLNPAASSLQSLEKIAHLGRLIGLSVLEHTKIKEFGGIGPLRFRIPLKLPSLVWKTLVGQRLDRTDLTEVDAAMAHLLAALRASDVTQACGLFRSSGYGLGDKRAVRTTGDRSVTQTFFGSAMLNRRDILGR